MSGGSMAVMAWWMILSSVAVFNLCAWALTARALLRRRASMDPEVYSLRLWHVLLSAGYAFGCAFRSILPRADVQRICLYDTWLSSVLLGRSVATVAELCLVLQWSLVLAELGRGSRVPSVTVLARMVVPIIAVAEVCSWYAVLTTNYLGNSIEESLWTSSASLMLVGLVTVWPRYSDRARRFLGAAILSSMFYLIYMVTVDVPMYITRWREDEASGKPYLSLPAGIRDAAHRWTVTHRWEDWRSEMSWMTLYFSATVWFSIALMRVPHIENEVRPRWRSGGGGM